jgi:hypothetical protein
MVGYTVLKVRYRYIIRYNNKKHIQIIIQILFLKLRNALYPNICGNDIIFRLKWVGCSLNSYIKCKLVQWRQLWNYVCQKTWFIIRAQVSTTCVCTMNEYALLSSQVTTGKYQIILYACFFDVICRVQWPTHDVVLLYFTLQLTVPVVSRFVYSMNLQFIHPSFCAEVINSIVSWYSEFFNVLTCYKGSHFCNLFSEFEAEG